MELVVATATLQLEELLSKRGNPYWGLTVDGDAGERRYAFRGARVPSQGDQLPTLVFVAGNPVRLEADEERPSRFAKDSTISVDGRTCLASVRVTMRRDGDWNVTAAVRLAPSERQQRPTVGLTLTVDELHRARKVAGESGVPFEDWLADLVRRAIPG